MRVRTALGRALVSASALVAVVGGLAAPASAGNGPSTACSDGTGAYELDYVTSPVTLTAEVNRYPNDTTQQIQLCYSTTPVGSPGDVGGWIYVRYDYDTDGYLRVTVDCDADPTTLIGPLNQCQQIQVGLDLNLDDGTSYECVLNNPLGGACVHSMNVPWAAVTPVISVTVWGIGPITLPLPRICGSPYGCP